MPRKLVVITEDGYRYWKQKDGSWGDGESSWLCFADMMISLCNHHIGYDFEMEEID